MCITERNTMIYQIISSICRICKSMACTLAHNFFVEFHCRNHTGKQCQTTFDGINGIKRQFFVFLHVFIISKRNAFHSSQNRHQCTVHAACFSTYQFSNIRILFLRHDTAAGAVCIIDFHKLILVGIPDDDFLAETAQMHHDCR